VVKLCWSERALHVVFVRRDRVDSRHVSTSLEVRVPFSGRWRQATARARTIFRALAIFNCNNTPTGSALIDPPQPSQCTVMGDRSGTKSKSCYRPSSAGRTQLSRVHCCFLTSHFFRSMNTADPSGAHLSVPGRICTKIPACLP